MIEAIHQSSLSMALRCGEQFRRRYVEGQVIPPSIAAARGTGVHAANETNLKYKIINKADMPLGDLLDATRDGYRRAFEVAGGQVYLPKEDHASKTRLLNDGLNDALRCTGIYRAMVAPKINPVAVEEPFRLDVGLSLPLAGRMDYQETPVVGDLKTAEKTWAEGRIATEIQPVFYSFAHEATRGVRPEFVYHILVARKNKDGKPTSADYQQQRMTPRESHYKALFAKLRAFVNMLEFGVFPPANPSSWWCGERWCGYYLTCPYVGN